MRVYSAEVRITTEDLHKHLRFPFVLKEPALRLEIKYAYSPKTYEGSDTYELAEAAFRAVYPDNTVASRESIQAELPLNNHVTLSLDYEGRLVGTAHRHENKAIYFVSEHKASAGFTPTAIGAGEWAVVLSTHAILDDVITATIEVDAE